MQLPSRTVIALLLVGPIYVASSCIIHYIVVPEDVISEANAPRTGTIIKNERAGERIVVTRDRFETNGTSVQIEVTLNPGGAVPVAHVHGSVEEYFEVLEGQVTFMLDGTEQVLRAGESVTVKAGTPHVPSNPSAAPARFRVTLTPPGDLDMCLVQVHNFLSSGSEAPGSLHTLFQMTRYASAYDIYLTGIPITLQQLGIWLITPTLRMLGYQPWSAQYAMRNHPPARKP